MDKLLQELYRLRDKLWFEGFGSGEPTKLYENVDNDDFDLVIRLIDDAFEEGGVRECTNAGDALNVILQDYELEKLNGNRKVD